MAAHYEVNLSFYLRCGDSARPGWSFSTLVVLPDPVSSWTYILDNRRVPSSETARTIGVQQLQAILPRLPPIWGRPSLLLDRRYSAAPWVQDTADLPLAQARVEIEAVAV